MSPNHAPTLRFTDIYDLAAKNRPAFIAGGHFLPKITQTKAFSSQNWPSDSIS